MACEAIVLVDPVSSGRYLKSYVAAAGYKLIGVFTLDQDELKRSGKFIPYEEKVALCDVVLHCKSAAQALEALADLPYRIAAVIPASEPGVEIGEAVAAQLGLKGNAADTSFMRRDKYEMRRAIAAAGLSGPKFAACYQREDALAFAKKDGLPVVLKTPRGAGAHHVFVCRTIEEVGTAFDVIVSEPNVFNESAVFALAESYVSGQQYAVELFADGHDVHLIGVWRLELGVGARGGTRFERITMLSEPADLADIRHVVDYSIAAGRAVGVQWGPFLVELRDDPRRGPALIEVSARLSGIDLPLLIRESSSFDPFASTIEAFVKPGRYQMKEVRFSKAARLLFCPSDVKGVIEGFAGLEEIAQLPSHLKSTLFSSPGDTMVPSGDLASIPLYVYLAHEDKAQLEADTLIASERFGVNVVP